MVQHISRLISTSPFYADQTMDIEQDAAWHGDLSINEAADLLQNQKPYTYIISRLANTDFLLSYVRDEDQSIVHVQFNKTEDDRWRYKNGAENIEPSLKDIIRKMMHLSKSMPDPSPFRS